jgi:hypothetical protein
MLATPEEGAEAAAYVAAVDSRGEADEAVLWRIREGRMGTNRVERIPCVWEDA